jgi:hypothetical protein
MQRHRRVQAFLLEIAQKDAWTGCDKCAPALPGRLPGVEDRKGAPSLEVLHVCWGHSRWATHGAEHMGDSDTRCAHDDRNSSGNSPWAWTMASRR